MKRIMMEGYVTGRIENKTIYGIVVEITTYQGEHCDEYLVREVKSGRCSLFYKGILQFSWKEVDKKKVGGFTVYEKGKAIRSQDWNELDGKEYRYIENRKHGLEMVIEGNGVIYRGGFDSMESMKREGKGMEVDEKSGKVLRYGVWKDDELFQVIQEFESEEVMIEYEVEEGKENMSVLNRHPVYEGGYVFDEATSSYLRDGDGCEIDVNTGCAMKEGKWERGTLVEGVDLFDGWYVKMEGNEAFDWGVKVKEVKVEIHNWNEWQNVSKKVTELVISSKCCNEEDCKAVNWGEFVNLRELRIGDECFMNVGEMKLDGMQLLTRVVIGKNCFTLYINKWPPTFWFADGFHLKNCPQVKELVIGSYSFSDDYICEIENNPSLEKIEIGVIDKKNSICRNFNHGSFSLKSEYCM